MKVKILQETCITACNMARVGFMLCALLFSNHVTAQNINISGRVTTGGESLPGVSIIVQGTAQGTVTDVDGNYTLAVPDQNSVLVFSFIGFATQHVTVGNQTNIDVSLAIDIIALEAVVVIGYGTQDKKEITSSVASIKAKDFNQGNINSPQQLLQGKVAGLTIAKPGGDPNGEFNIRLRGLSTLGANTSPLVVIDGLIGGSLLTIDPNDIASIDVLKDGGAAAIYGTRGSSGVILITTKRGIRGQTNINYRSYLSVEVQARTLEVADADMFSALPLVTPDNVFGANTNWLEEITQTAVGHVHNLSASGGMGNTSYRVSVNFRNMDGIQRGTGFGQVNGRLFIDQRAANDRIQLTGFVAATNRNEDRGFAEAFRYATVYNPTVPVRNPDGTFFETGGFDTFNPVAIIEQNSSVRERSNLAGGMKLGVELFDGLVLGGYYGQQTENILATEHYSKNARYRGADRNGFVRVFNDKLLTEQADFTATYDTNISNLVLRVLVGTSYQRFAAQGSRIFTGDFVSDDILDNLSLSADIANGLAEVSSYKRQSQLFAVFARVNLNFNNNFFLSATVRPEGHDRFGVENRWGTFGAVSGGVNISNLMDTGPFSYLKLRASWGLTGNIPNLDLIAPAVSTLIASGNAFIGGSFGQAFAPGSNPNPFLKWEEKTEIDVGFDFELFGGKMRGTVDYYNRTTSGLLRNQEVPVPPNLFRFTLRNVGEIQNSGFEFSVEYDVALGSDLTWTPAVNFATFQNELKALEREEPQRIGSLGSPGLGGAFPIRVAPGDKLGQIFVPIFNGILPDGTWDVSTDETEFEVVGNGLPNFTFNMANSFSYKNWDLNFLLRGVFGHSLVNSLRVFYEQPNVAPTYNVLASSNRPELSGLTTNEARLSSFYVEKADFLTLDNLTLGHNIAGLSESTAFKSLRFYVSVQNLFILTKYEGVDPEVRFADPGQVGNGDFQIVPFSDPLAPGIDRRNTWFTTRTFTVGFNVGF